MNWNQAYTFEALVRIMYGSGVSARAGAELHAMGATRVLVVTDPGVRGAGVAKGPLAALTTAGLEYHVYDGVRANPTIANCEQAAGVYISHRCDAVLAVGGGSSMDTAKVAGILVTGGGHVREYRGPDMVTRPLPPFVCVPTTCGTGAETTYNAVITDEEAHAKIPIVSPRIAPRTALIDPELVRGLPRAVAAMTDADALTHAIESFTNQNPEIITGVINLGAIRLIGQHLRPAVGQGNPDALGHMLVAATMAGITLNMTAVGLVHAMSDPICAHFGLAHGLANGILLPYVMEFNLLGNPERHAEIAAALGERVEGLPVLAASRRAVAAVRSLLADIGIPRTLAEAGVPASVPDQVVAHALKSRNIAWNCRRVTAADVARVYQRAMAGVYDA